jgi:hypothetical protein
VKLVKHEYSISEAGVVSFVIRNQHGVVPIRPSAWANIPKKKKNGYSKIEIKVTQPGSSPGLGPLSHTMATDSLRETDPPFPPVTPINNNAPTHLLLPPPPRPGNAATTRAPGPHVGIAAQLFPTFSARPNTIGSESSHTLSSPDQGIRSLASGSHSNTSQHLDESSNGANTMDGATAYSYPMGEGELSPRSDLGNICNSINSSNGVDPWRPIQASSSSGPVSLSGKAIDTYSIISVVALTF